MGLSESGEGDPLLLIFKDFRKVDAGYGGAEAILIGVCLPVLQQEEQKRVAMI